MLDDPNDPNGYSAEYGYLDNSDLINEMAYKRGGTQVFTAGKTYDNMNRA